MSTIQMDTAKLRSQANQLKKYRENHMQTMNKLSKLISSLNDVWKGEAQDAFVAKYQSMKPSFRDLHDFLYDYAKLMKKAADEMERTDTELKSKIQRIG